mmetsp:Transcript_7221/g.18758  ORF Transcript_7221/g.18758 Transcript_7221/m.18758 type:complete len:222 (+) Transcript_7221:1632-2297(+)
MITSIKSLSTSATSGRSEGSNVSILSISSARGAGHRSLSAFGILCMASIDLTLGPVAFSNGGRFDMIVQMIMAREYTSAASDSSGLCLVHTSGDTYRMSTDGSLMYESIGCIEKGSHTLIFTMPFGFNMIFCGFKSPSTTPSLWRELKARSRSFMTVRASGVSKASGVLMISARDCSPSCCVSVITTTIPRPSKQYPSVFSMLGWSSWQIRVKNSAKSEPG